MAQATLGTTPEGDDTPENETNDEAETGETEPESLDFVDYLDVNRLKFISALAGTFDSVAEAEKFIEAERKRWNRDDVLRILTNRREELAEQ